MFCMKKCGSPCSVQGESSERVGGWTTFHFEKMQHFFVQGKKILKNLHSSRIFIVYIGKLSHDRQTKSSMRIAIFSQLMLFLPQHPHTPGGLRSKAILIYCNSLGTSSFLAMRFSATTAVVARVGAHIQSRVDR